MNQNLLILGAGQYGSVVKEIANELGFFQRIVFLDDCHGKDSSNFGKETIGKLDEYERFLNDYTYAIPAIGNPVVRLELLQKLEESGFRIPILVSTSAYVSPSAHLEPGVVIEPLAGVHANSYVGKGSYISMGAVVNHNAVVAECCHIDNNAVVMSGALVADGVTTEPCEVVRRNAVAFEKQTRQFDGNEEWVKEHMKSNGREPSMF